MDSRKYKEETSAKKVLSYSTLQLTIKELNEHNEPVLENKLKEIIGHNKIEKPALHQEPGDQVTTYYKIDLDDAEIDKIAELFVFKATEFVQDGAATATFLHYESIAEEWLNLK